MGNEPIICDICGKEFTSTRSSFRRHLRDKHNIVETVEYGVKCIEPNCNFTCSMLKDLRQHLESHHDMLQEVDELLFRDIQEFNMWKTDEESRCVAIWVKRHGKLKKSDATIYYYCNRSGKRRLVAADQRIRKMKSQGSRKIDFACTSAITAKTVPEGIKVKYYKTHYGHDNKIDHIPLPETTKSNIASQLMQGISPREILNKAKEESMNTDTKRITKQDIHNIVREYNLYSHVKNDKVKVVSGKISKLERNHQIATTSTDLLAIQHDNEWKVLSDGAIYSIKINNLEDNHICKQKCEECLSCVHSYSCTCVDFVVNGQMCKHIHKMGLEMLRNHMETSEEEEGEEIIEFQNIFDVSPESPDVSIVQENIKRIIDDISMSDWVQISDQQTLNKINDNLKAALNLMSGDQSSVINGDATAKAESDIRVQTFPSVAVLQLVSPMMPENPSASAETSNILQKYRPIVPLNFDLTSGVTNTNPTPDGDLESSKLLQKTTKILQKYRPIAQATEPRQSQQDPLTEFKSITPQFEEVEETSKFRPSILRRKVARQTVRHSVKHAQNT